MALAKFLEDISDRFFEDLATRDRLEAIYDPGTFIAAAPEEPTGWVRLTLDRGTLPDRIALVEGERLSFSIMSDKANAIVKAQFTVAPLAKMPKVRIARGQIDFTLNQDGLYVLRVSCGSYFKDYEFDVSRTLDLDRQVPIQQGYVYLQDRPDEWTRERLDTLKRLLIPANRPAGVPDSFCKGIVDYHLALYHAEHDNFSIANSRFEDAYKNLRPFIAHSDVAHFICDYILYLMNRFEGCEARGSAGRFGGLRAFFNREYNESLNSCHREIANSSGRYIEVLVKSIDQRMLEVVREICQEESSNLSVSVESLENRLKIGNYDAACRTRLNLVLARGFRRMGMMKKAADYYQKVTQTITANKWHAESNEFQSKRK